jgi:hypothetical protein
MCLGKEIYAVLVGYEAYARKSGVELCGRNEFLREADVCYRCDVRFICNVGRARNALPQHTSEPGRPCDKR